MRKVAVLVTRGELNHIIQVVTLLMAATVAEAAVRVLFRDEAVLSITTRGARHLPLSARLRPHATAIRARLKHHDMNDLPTMLQTVKGHGDVRLWACRSSLLLYGVSADALLPEIDGVQGLTAFVIDEMATADQVWTF